MIFGMGCLQAAFSMADVEPEELRPTLTPMVLGAMAQQLALKGKQRVGYPRKRSSTRSQRYGPARWKR